MRWIKQKILNWLHSDEEECITSDYATSDGRNYYDTIGNSVLNSCDCIIFKVYNAKGGTIVEVTKNSSRKDHDNNLYIITSTENFGEEISKILFLEKI